MSIEVNPSPLEGFVRLNLSFSIKTFIQRFCHGYRRFYGIKSLFI